MLYRKNFKNGDNLSILGFGCMRFTKKGGLIDQAKAEEELLHAIKNGINYFDTAYTYPGCEAALGKFLSHHDCRKKIFIADKLPHYLMKKPEDIEKCFIEQLKRLQTDYIDYYLMHMLTGIESWNRLKELGIEQWIADKKASGAIRNIGFSFHGGNQSFCQIVDGYDWDFCMIQFNYFDEHNQAGDRGLAYASEKGLPVMVMEPLRGGKLTDKGLPQAAAEQWRQFEPKRSAAEWALRWVWNHPQVTLLLSGMNDIAQIDENVRVAATAIANSLKSDELAYFQKVRDEININTKVPCTGCGYCLPCPHGVDIPTCFNCYNDKYTDGWIQGMKEYMMYTTMRAVPSNASHCQHCHRCEERCPQSIPICEHLEKITKEMETPLYQIGAAVLRLFSKF